MFNDTAADAAPLGVAGEAGAGLAGMLGPVPAEQPAWCVYIVYSIA